MSFILLLLAAVVLSPTSSQICDGNSQLTVIPEDEHHLQNVSTKSCFLSVLDVVLSSCTTVHFVAPQYSLPTHESLSFKNLHNVRLIGRSEKTVIDCHGTGGFQFTNVTNLDFKGFQFVNCSKEQSMTISWRVIKTFHFKSGLHISNCTNVSFKNIAISKSECVGISVFSTAGEVRFQRCTFEQNGRSNHRGGSGLIIEISGANNGYRGINDTKYLLRNCVFMDNFAFEKDIKSTPFGRGGGLRIYIRDASFNNRIIVHNCTFLNNTASRWGGGLFISVHDTAANNLLNVSETRFLLNKSPDGLGGGVCTGFQCGNTSLPRQCLNNRYVFHSCIMKQNTAHFGGGSIFTSTRTFDGTIPGSLHNKLWYFNCTWEENSALYGSAVAMLPDTWSILVIGVLPSPVFRDCKIIGNYIKNSEGKLQKPPYRHTTMGYGGIYCVLYRVVFKGELHVVRNNGSGIYGSSCFLTFKSNSSVLFHLNHGYSGGGVHLLGYSTFHVTRNSTFVFSNNSADTNGGAIHYHSSDIVDHDYSYNCFISRDEKVPSGEAKLLFKGNKVGLGGETIGYGNSIYSTSLLPCLKKYNDTSKPYLNSVVNISFSDSKNYSLATEISGFSTNNNINSQEEIPVIPGKQTQLHFKGLDDFNQSLYGVYLLTVENLQNSSVAVYGISYVTDGSIRLQGNPGDEAILTLSTITQRKSLLSFRVKMEPCPPGYTHENSICQCSADSYIGIESCNDSTFTASTRRGYWYGYDNSKSYSTSSFISGFCPRGFCRAKHNHCLPNIASKDLLNNVVCGSLRRGILCTICQKNHSVYYHSPNFKCGTEHHCDMGILFYFLSDIVPATILFTVVLMMNISFTSGCLNGFIMYAQVIRFFQFPTEGHHGESHKKFLDIIGAFYDTFNLQFFNHDSLSFCLFKDGRAMTVYTIQYATLFYSLFLILFIRVVLKLCNIRKIKLFFKCRVKRVQVSIVHGLSAFLVLCFAQCANLSITIVRAAFVLGKRGKTVKRVAYLNGEIDWLSKDHLIFVLPASIITLGVVVVPLVMLLAYPLCNKCLMLPKLAKMRAVLMCQRIERLKPILDSFQGGYRDNCRFFAGLHLLYRAIILLTVAVCHLDVFYYVLEVELLLMFLVHAIAQPYKKRRHNVIDALLFANMAAINGTSLYLTSIINMHSFSTFSGIQLFLFLLPLACVVIYTGCCSVRFLHSKCPKKQSETATQQTNDMLGYCDLRASDENFSTTASLTSTAYKTFDY